MLHNQKDSKKDNQKNSAKIGICIPTFNSKKTIGRTLNSIAIQNKSLNIHCYIVDDGSTDNTPEILTVFSKNNKNINIFLDEHKERGITRKKTIDLAMADGCEYILFVDSDMALSPNLIENCIDLMLKYNYSALIIPELPYSDHSNFMTKLKIFERKLVNSETKDVSENSIEAARFWKVDEYKKSGEIDPSQIAFEEIQPTIRIIEKGGLVGRITEEYIEHDEGYVSFGNLMKKKYYYFGQMSKTLVSEEKGSTKAATRWYFFRSYLYTSYSIRQYLRYPQLFIGLIFMYICLSFIAVFALLKSKYVTTI